MSASEVRADDLFDVVDERDQVLRQTRRSEVHARNWLHRAVHVLVHDETGRLFLQRRSLTKDRFPDCWDNSCTGHVDAGEDYVTAAWRELGEELGWHGRGQPLRHVLKLAASPETGYEFIEVYVLGPIAGPFVLCPKEISEGRWVNAAEMDALFQESPDKLAGVCRLLWREYREEVLRVVATRE